MRSRFLLALVAAGALLALIPATGSAAGRFNACRPYRPAPCLLPFPNDLMTVKDRTPTGRRVNLPAAAMPVNTKGVAIANGDYDRADGFSPGGTIIARVPGLDTPQAFRKSHIVSNWNPGASFAPKQPVLLIDEANAKRRLIWAELDAHAPNPASTNLIIHAGRNLRERHHYIVVLRNLRNADGKLLRPPHWFKVLRRQRGGGSPALRRDVPRYTRIFRVLKRAGVRKPGLYMAWDFTVASRKSLTGRLLSIRNGAFRRLGDSNLSDGVVQGAAPAFHVDKVEDFTPEEDDRIARTVTGTFTVPCYLDQAGCPPGSRFHYASADPDARPAALPGNTIQAPFICNIPRAALDSPARPSLYGHGLLGGPDEINAGNVKDMSQEHDMIFCGTTWAGMAEEDIPNVIGVLGDLNRFPTVADRLQQGVLDFLYLGRLMIHSQGFVSNPAFQPGGKTVIDTSHLYYDGNSQGGIEGGITTAVAPDFTHAVLGVSGMDYGGLLLQRSKDWPTYEKFIAAAYPDPSERPLLLDLIQQLWDRGEPDGYAGHMTTDPLPNTPAHTVLMQIAFGDFQVSDFAAEIEARTIGAHVYRPALDAGRWPGKNNRAARYIPPIKSFPFDGSALVYWDSGPGHTGQPPLSNLPPSIGEDPHENPRATKAARAQKSAFLEPDGKVIDVCGGRPCHTDVFTP
jgi:hypothetical protein